MKLDYLLQKLEFIRECQKLPKLKNGTFRTEVIPIYSIFENRHAGFGPADNNYLSPIIGWKVRTSQLP